MNDKSSLKVAIINSNREIADTMELYIAHEGYKTVVRIWPEIEKQEGGINKFFEDENPDVVLWDISEDYEKELEYINKVKNSVEGQSRRFVVTSQYPSEVRSKIYDKGMELTFMGEPFTDMPQLLKVVSGEINIKGEGKGHMRGGKEK